MPPAVSKLNRGRLPAAVLAALLCIGLFDFRICLAADDVALQTDVVDTLLKSIQAADGIYTLDETARFDDLHAVVFDSQNQSLTLLGERRKPGQSLSIHYLDHLGAALESDNPTFTLPWSEESTRQADVVFREARSNSTALWDRIAENARRKLFSGEGRLTKEGLRILRTLNFPIEGYESYLTNKFDVMAKTFELCGGGQQAILADSYARSLRDPDALNAAIRELAMGRALEASETEPATAELWETFLRRFAGVFDADERKPVEVFRQARAGGEHIVFARNAAVESILAGQEPLFAKTFANALELRAATHPHIYLPPDLVRSLAQIDIQVVPTWNRIVPTSRMAEVMLESDMLLKWIVSDPKLLGSAIPGHLTEFDWSRRQHESGGTKTAMNNVRFWISPDQVQLTESNDGSVLEFRKFTMRVNTNDPATRPYAAQLTSFYDTLAERFSVLNELREAAKTVVVAQWLKRRAPNFRLPKEGRLRWAPPATVPGFISIDATVNVDRRETPSQSRLFANWRGQLVLEGGVSLALGQATRTDGSVLFDGARGPAENLGRVSLLPAGAAGAVELGSVRRTIVPLVYDNQELKEIVRQHTIPPPPMPAGATGRAELGRRKLDYITVLQPRLGDKANTAVVQQDLQAATQLAKKLKLNDDLLNGMQAGRIRSMQAFQQMEDWARDTRNQMLFDMYDTLTGGLSNFLSNQEVFQFRTFMAEYIDSKDLSARQYALLVNKYAPQVKTFLSDADTARASIGKEDKFDLHMTMAGRGLDLTNEMLKGMELIEDTPVSKRAFGYASLVLDTYKIQRTIIEIDNNRRDVGQLGEQLGNEAQFIARLQTRRAADLNKLEQILHRLQRAGD